MMMAFGIAVGIALLMCYRVMTRLPKRRVINGYFLLIAPDR